MNPFALLGLSRKKSPSRGTTELRDRRSTKFPSSRPPAEWAEYFPKAWDHPSSWTSSHRPGISAVVGDRIWLNGTTVEEVEKTHKATLELALAETNQKYAEYEAKQREEKERERKELEAHEQHVREAAKKIRFD